MTLLSRHLEIALSVAIMLFGYSISANAMPIVSEKCHGKEIECARMGNLDIVSIYGFIGKEDADFFDKIDKAIPDDKIFPKIYLDSEGGNIYDAKIVGRILRKHNATVENGSPFFPDKFIECTSACVFIAAGATTRQLDHIGIHQGYTPIYHGPRDWHNDPLQPSLLELDLTYFDEMGIDPDIKAITIATPSDQMSDFYFDPNSEKDGQKIIKLGFHMLDQQSNTLPKMPIKLDEIYEARDNRAENAINYGYSSLIPIIVEETEKTPKGKAVNYPAINKWLELGAKQNDPWSLYNLGVHIQFGRGTPIDLKRASNLYLRAARLGMGPAENNIGWNYYKAIGIKRSITDAVFWITRAAENGEPFGYGSLCEMYDAGDVFERNDIEAYKWCKLSVDNEPEGHAKMNDVLILSKYRKKLSLDDWNTGETLARNWKPLMKTLYSNGHDTDDE